MAPPITLIALGAGSGAIGAGLFLGLIVKTGLDEPEYDDEGNEIEHSSDRVNATGIAMAVLLASAAVSLPVGFIWLRKRRMERRRIWQRHQDEQHYLQGRSLKVSLEPQGVGGRLRLVF